MKGLGFTCLPHPDPPFHLPPHPFPPGDVKISKKFQVPE